MGSLILASAQYPGRQILGGLWPAVTSAAEDSLVPQKWVSGWKQFLGCGSSAKHQTEHGDCLFCVL